MSAAQIIGESVVRLAVDYDAALVQADGDETTVDLYLPGEWVILARRVLALIMTETARLGALSAQRTAKAAARHACAGCGSTAFCVVRDIWTERRGVECLDCGMVCHV